MQTITVTCARSAIYAPQHVAEHAGYFAEEGLHVAYHQPPTPYGMVGALRSGAADLLLGNVWLVFAEHGTSDPLVALAQSNRQCHHFVYARKPEPGFDWAALRGRTLLVPSDAPTPWIALRSVLRQIDISLDEVRLVTGFSPADCLAQFTAGLGEYALLNPEIAEPVHLEPLAPLADVLGPVPWSVYAARRSFVEQRGAAIVAFGRALRRGLAWIATSDADATAAVLAPRLGRPAEDVEPALRRLQAIGLWPASQEVDREAAERWQDRLLEFGLLATPASVLDCLLTEHVTSGEG